MGPANVNDFYPYENSFALDSLQNVNIFKIDFTSFGRMPTLAVNIFRDFVFSTTSGLLDFLLLFRQQPASQPASQLIRIGWE